MSGLLYTASRDTTTGEVSFYDKAGNVLCAFTPQSGLVDDPTKPLYLLSREAGSTVWLEGDTTYVDDNTFETSPDGTTWTGQALGSANAITLNRGDGVYIRARVARTTTTTIVSQVPVCIMMTGTIEAYHNANSMLSPDFASITDLTTIGKNTLQGLFSPNTTSDTATARNTALVRAPLLPATTLAPYCYNSMFLFCSNLTTPPTLPATTLAAYCYNNMFNQSGLTVAPALPATVVVDSCYKRMLKACAFSVAPLLPATTLARACYQYMFEGCSNLCEVRIAATTISASNALSSWLAGVAATGDFYCVEGVEYATDSANGIPTGWTRRTL